MKTNNFSYFSSFILKAAQLVNVQLVSAKLHELDKNETISIYICDKTNYSEDKLEGLTITLKKDIILLLELSEEIDEKKRNVLKELLIEQWNLFEERLSTEYQLKARDLLLYTSKTLASSLRLEDVLKQILNNTLEVIEAADAGSLYLYNEKEDLIIPMVTGGFNWKYLRQIRFKPGESLTGKAFSDQYPRILHKSEDVYKGMGSMSESNRYYFDLAVPKVSGGIGAISKSAMCCPFIVKGKCMGVVTINNFFTDAQFREEDLELLKAICNQASLAFERANLFQEIEIQMVELKALNKTIKQNNNMLEYASKTHSKLTEIALQQKGMNEIGKTIAEIIGKPIVIYNEYIYMLTSNGDREELGFVPEMPSFLDKFREVINKKQPLTIQTETEYHLTYPISIVPIIISNEVRGFMVIVKKDEQESELEQTTIEQACTVIALEILKQETINETEQRLKGEFLDDVYSNVNIELIKKQAKYIGISEGNNYNFIAFEIDQLNSNQNSDLKKVKQFQQIIERLILQQNPSSVIFNRKNGVQALVGWSKGTNEEASIVKAKDLIEDIKKTLAFYAPDISCSCAIGRLVRDLDELYLSYRNIKQCIEIFYKKKASWQFMTYKDIGPARIIMNSSTEELYQFVKDHLQPLIDYNYQNRKDLIDTLEMYLKYNQNMTEMAENLHLHINTLNYRLKRVEGILGIQLKDMANIFNLQLAWNIMDTLGVKEKWLNLN